LSAACNIQEGASLCIIVLKFDEGNGKRHTPLVEVSELAIGPQAGRHVADHGKDAAW
jgi:hypothetical protein